LRRGGGFQAAENRKAEAWLTYIYNKDSLIEVSYMHYWKVSRSANIT